MDIDPVFALPEFVPNEIVAEVISQEQGIADDAAAGLVPLPMSRSAVRTVPQMPWSTYAAMLRGL